MQEETIGRSGTSSTGEFAAARTSGVLGIRYEGLDYAALAARLEMDTEEVEQRLSPHWCGWIVRPG